MKMDFRKAYGVKNLLTLCTVLFLVLSLLMEGTLSWLFFVFACLSGAVMRYINFKFWKCPDCGKNLGGSKPTYCPHCSKKLEWMG